MGELSWIAWVGTYVFRRARQESQREGGKMMEAEVRDGETGRCYAASLKVEPKGQGTPVTCLS